MTGAAVAAPVVDTDDEKRLVVYNWKEYIDPEVLERFTRETGVEIQYENMESNDQLDAKLRAGHAGYDVVFPSGTYLRRQIAGDLYLKLDKSRLKHLDETIPTISRKLRMFDPDNEHAVDYLFGTTGVAYNVAAVGAAMPDAPVDSLAMIWDPAVVSRFAKCGVAVLDAPTEVVGSALLYLGKDPNSEKPEDLAAAAKVMMAARPYIRLASSDYIKQLVSGEICVGLDWSGDALQARGFAADKDEPVDIEYRLPHEGAFVFLDTMAIPADAKHVKNAHLFIDFLMRPDVAARNSTFTGYPNGSGPSWLMVEPAVIENQNFFPLTPMQEKLFPDLPESAEFTARLQRVWTRFRTGIAVH